MSQVKSALMTGRRHKLMKTWSFPVTEGDTFHVQFPRGTCSEIINIGAFSDFGQNHDGGLSAGYTSGDIQFIASGHINNVT